jgi:four helix bundle protein
MEHNKLDAYNVALEFVPRAHNLAGGFPRGHGDLADQLRRASTSIALNIAEGAGEYSPKDKAKFYRFAKRSAAECGAVIDIAVKLDPALDVAENVKLLERLMAMLIRLAKSCDG